MESASRYQLTVEIEPEFQLPTEIINAIPFKLHLGSFEEMVKELASLALHGTGLEIVLQRDLNTLIKANELANEPRDISWLKEQIKANIFPWPSPTNAQKAMIE